MLLAILLYTLGVVGTYAWMHETWDVEDLIMPEAVWAPFAWPVIALCFAWHCIAESFHG